MRHCLQADQAGERILPLRTEVLLHACQPRVLLRVLCRDLVVHCRTHVQTVRGASCVVWTSGDAIALTKGQQGCSIVCSIGCCHAEALSGCLLELGLPLAPAG